MFVRSKLAYAVQYLVFTWIFGMCYGFVLLSSAAGAGNAADVLEPGGSWLYGMQSTLLLNEKDVSGKDVGFMVAGDVLVQVLWGSSDQQRLLKFEVSPSLHIKSRKAPAPDGFVPHSSNLDSFKHKQFYVHSNRGKIEKILLPKDERLSLANLKKGIASLFQFQLMDLETNETDSSGHCKVTYVSSSPTVITKYKTDCVSDDLPHVYNPEVLLGVNVESLRMTTYEIDSNTNIIEQISLDEKHIMFLNAKEDIGNNIEAHQTLILKEQTTVDILEGNSIEEVLEKINDQEGIAFTQESLITEKESWESDGSKKKFSAAINEYRENLKKDMLGTLVPGKTFIRLVGIARKSTKDDIAKALGSKKNKEILHQLYDMLGFTQTKESHEAAMKKLHLENPDHEEFSERYLWALSMSSQPNPDIIIDLLNKYRKYSDFPPKVKETLLLTLASMAHRLSKLPSGSRHSKIISQVEEILSHGFKNAKAEDRFIFLRAIRNLRAKSSLPLLLDVVKTGVPKEEVLAWKAIQSFGPSYWDEQVKQSAFRTFFQTDKIHDSSSRTIAGDILLEGKPSTETLTNLIHFLLSEDKRYEVKQYLWQKVKVLADGNSEFERSVSEIIRSNSKLNNYHVLAPKGLSTALTRRFLENRSINGSLITVNEMSNGIVKRGIVNIVLEKNESLQEICGLDIFSGGLSSFVSSDSDDSDPDETVTAGIELTLLGTQIRPFVFFSGQGELMGHVWSGTASEMTPAFQALAMLQDHKEFIRLGTGLIAELEVKGGVSFDLSGKIEISLWNRNAASVVQKSAGIMVEGTAKVDTDFVRSQTEFMVSIEPRLNLQTDIDFSSDVQLCMRLSQPESTLRHNTFKIERIPGSKHRLRKARYRKHTVPGKTYALNKKNSEMCSSIYGL